MRLTQRDNYFSIQIMYLRALQESNVVFVLAGTVFKSFFRNLSDCCREGFCFFPLVKNKKEIFRSNFRIMREKLSVFAGGVFWIFIEKIHNLQ